MPAWGARTALVRRWRSRWSGAWNGLCGASWTNYGRQESSTDEDRAKGRGDDLRDLVLERRIIVTHAMCDALGHRPLPPYLTVVHHYATGGSVKLNDKERRRVLAQQAKSAGNWDIMLRAGAWLGAITGFFIGVWLMLATAAGWSILAPIVLAAVGAFVGWRVVLAIWAR